MARTALYRLAFWVLLLQSIAAAPAFAQTTVQQNFCAAAKVEASGLFMSAVLNCYATSRTGTPDAKCVRQATRGLEVAFAFLERWTACETTGDSQEVVSRVLTTAADLSSMVRAPRPTQCATGELEAMQQDAVWQYSCTAAAALKGPTIAVDAGCQDRATGTFTSLFERAARRRDCGPSASDASAIDTRIRQAAREARGTISTPITTCTPIEIAAVHGSHFGANSRLAKIENGAVACMHADDMTLASCAFSSVPGKQSGEWLESPQGLFALVGQSIALDGRPGGEYVIAARASDSAPAACVEASGLDTLGLIMSGFELQQNCTLEEPLADYNALEAQFPYFSPLLNYADREVCSNHNPAINPHPDGAELVRSYASSGSGPDDIFCYKGWGAALNDINGTERDDNFIYLIGEQYCHYMRNGSFEVPAAKRPASFSSPAPGGVNPKSSIVWRPVIPHLVMANGAIPGSPLQLFYNKHEFLLTTSATDATGPLPYLGQVGTFTTVGTVTFSVAYGGNTLYIGVQGTGEPDWYPALPGNDIGLGYENLQVQTATPVYSLGFDFAEPNLTMPFDGGVPVDSTFEMVLYLGAVEVGRIPFNVTDDIAGFVGVWSDRAFDRITIVDTTGEPDNELFGQFYTGPVKKP